MKRSQNLISFLFLLLILGLSTSCQEDPCEEITCVNGTCSDSACQCDAGYEGAQCNTESRARLLGDWEVGDICRQLATIYPVTVTDGAAVNQVTFDNLNEQGFSVSGTVDGVSISVEEQAYGLWTITGTGGVDTLADVLSLEYRIDKGGGEEEVCQAVFRRF